MMGAVTIQVTAQAATRHCPNCLGKLRSVSSDILSDGITRRYRKCDSCGYGDRVVLIIERETACGA